MRKQPTSSVAATMGAFAVVVSLLAGGTLPAPPIPAVRSRSLSKESVQILRNQIALLARPPENGGAADGADYSKGLVEKIGACLKASGFYPDDPLTPHAKDVTIVEKAGDTASPVRVLVSGELVRYCSASGDSIAEWFGLLLPNSGSGLCELMAVGPVEQSLAAKEFLRKHGPKLEEGERPWNVLYDEVMRDGCVQRMRPEDVNDWFQRAGGEPRTTNGK